MKIAIHLTSISVVMLIVFRYLFALGQPVGNVASRARNSADTWHPQIVRHGRRIQIDIGDTSASPNTPLFELASALPKYPQVESFRIVWSFLVLSSGSQAVATYNRKRKTVFYRWYGEDSNGRWVHSYLFTGVTENIIVRSSREHEDGSVNSGWEDLPTYGCKLINLYKPRHKP